jgi:hypothetical protein
MDGFCAGDDGCHNHVGDVQVAVFTRPGTDTHSLISRLHVQAIRVRLRIHSHSGYAEFLTCANNPQRNLASIRYQYLSEHA